MSCELGICSMVCDQQAHAAVGPAWARAVKALSPRITFVRASIGAAADGTLDVALLRRGLAAFRDVGLEVRGVLEGSLARGDLAQNAALGWKGDPLKSPWIDSYTNNAIHLLQQLGALAPRAVWLLNEGNVQAAVNPLGTGEVIPELHMGEVPSPRKPEAMAPEVYWAAMGHAGYWLKKEVPAVQTVYPGALSLDLAFRTGLEDNWIGNYLGTGMAYLMASGAHPPYAWSGLSLNTEGLCSASYAAYIALHLAQLKARYGIVGPTILGEVGVPNSSPGAPVDAAAVQQTLRHLAGICASMSWFSAHPVGGYGCLGLSYQAGEIVPAAPLEWAGLLPALMDGL